MKKLPKIDISFSHIYRMLITPIQSQLLLTGIRLKIFDHLYEPASAEAIAKTIHAHTGNTRLLLDGLTGCCLLKKTDGFYQNEPATQSFLVESSPTYMGEMFTLSAEVWYSGLDNLFELVTQGPPTLSKENEMGSEAMWARFTTSWANAQRAGSAQQVAEMVSNLPEFSSFEKMLGLGGGPGLIEIAIVGSHPKMKGIIFDRPAIVSVAENFIKEYEMEDRMEILAGDYNYDSIGEGYDLILAANSLHYCKGDMSSLMKKICDALNPGGIFISLHEGLTHERTRPDIHIFTMTTTALTGHDMFFDQAFIADSMLQAGFKSVRSYTLDTDWGPMDSDIARKA